ncbi:hypothetical protein EV363DRAFT_1534663 [Boletus edulis]|nr:hypothetical protein EV363DRAFT_1534663 [Boletus edulis]
MPVGAGNVEARLAWIPQLILNVESTFQSDGTLPIMSSSATLRLWILACMTHSQFRHSHFVPRTSTSHKSYKREFRLTLDSRGDQSFSRVLCGPTRSSRSYIWLTAFVSVALWARLVLKSLVVWRVTLTKGLPFVNVRHRLADTAHEILIVKGVSRDYDLSDVLLLIGYGYVVSASSDLAIAAGLLVLLIQRRERALKGTQCIIQKLLINTGLWLALLSVFTFVTILAFKDTLILTEGGTIDSAYKLGPVFASPRSTVRMKSVRSAGEGSRKDTIPLAVTSGAWEVVVAQQGLDRGSTGVESDLSAGAAETDEGGLRHNNEKKASLKSVASEIYDGTVRKRTTSGTVILPTKMVLSSPQFRISDIYPIEAGSG